MMRLISLIGGLFIQDHPITSQFKYETFSNFNTTLYLETANWIPVNLSDYMNLTWNYKNQTVQPGAMVEATLTLSTSSSSSFFYYLLALPDDEFSFDVIIGARD